MAVAAAATLSAPLVAAAALNLVIVEHNVAPASPNWLTTGPDGNLWFTDSNHNSVDRVTLDGTVTAYPVLGSNVLPSEITSGPDGSLWFLEMNGQGTPPVTYVGRMTTSGVATEYPTNGGFFAGIAAGPDGDVWFNEADTFSVAKISPGGVVTEYPNPNGPSAELAGITAGPDGNMWVTDASEGIVWKVTTAGAFTAFNLPPGRQPAAITTGADGNLWFYENNANDIGRMTTAGSLTEFAIPTANASIAGLTRGADGNVWFTEVQPNQVGVISPAGHVQIASFHLDSSIPVWTYDIGDRRIEARIWMEPGAHTTYVAWRLRPCLEQPGFQPDPSRCESGHGSPAVTAATHTSDHRPRQSAARPFSHPGEAERAARAFLTIADPAGRDPRAAGIILLTAGPAVRSRVLSLSWKLVSLFVTAP